MKYIRWIIISLLAISPIIIFFWGSIKGVAEVNFGISKLKLVSLNDEITTEKIYGINTYDAEVFSKKIGNYYHEAAELLVSHSDRTKIYSWSDKIGYPRISVVLEVASGYVEVRASGYNDNDAMFIGFFPGVFSKPDAIEVSTISLPAGILRE